MYLDILNDNMVSFTNTYAIEMLDHLFLTYGSITAVDLEHTFKNLRKAWDPHQPMQRIFKQSQYCIDYAEAVGDIIGPACTIPGR
jgi:hypothetical protein